MYLRLVAGLGSLELQAWLAGPHIEGGPPRGGGLVVCGLHVDVQLGTHSQAAPTGPTPAPTLQPEPHRSLRVDSAILLVVERWPDAATGKTVDAQLEPALSLRVKLVG